ncbi:hypothetical protein J2847_000883 [Azospirillum agricola]|uniref:hypothetical protein n=1 Tax=Azospirillum agricola TaxID=1720247 RepID=UPI001AE6B5E8|nr:hypothetical protein [Azospirillum agricola]MBP2227603.1 hypothetical protein [Azospirillum agricola]
MIGTGDMARRELAALGDALSQAERGEGRHSPATLAARLMRVAALHPRAMDNSLLWQVNDLVASRDVGDRFKLVVVRMGWASIVQAEFKAWGLRPVDPAEAMRVQAA